MRCARLQALLKRELAEAEQAAKDELSRLERDLLNARETSESELAAHKLEAEAALAQAAAQHREHSAELLATTQVLVRGRRGYHHTWRVPVVQQPVVIVPSVRRRDCFGTCVRSWIPALDDQDPHRAHVVGSNQACFWFMADSQLRRRFLVHAYLLSRMLTHARITTSAACTFCSCLCAADAGEPAGGFAGGGRA